MIARAGDVLQGRLRDLRRLDEKYLALLRDSGIKANFDTLASRIKTAEANLERTIDSIDKIRLYGKKRVQLDQLNYSCKLVLEGHHSIDELQHAVVVGSRQISNDQQAILELSHAVRKRDSAITGFKMRSGDNNSGKFDIRFPDADMRLLQSENKFLQSELDLMQRNYQNLYNLQFGSDLDEKSARSQHSFQSGKTSVSPSLNHGGSGTKDLKYEGMPKE
jgi:hypothetical protein